MIQLIYNETFDFINENFFDIQEKNELKIMQKVSFLLDFYNFDECEEVDKIIILLALAKVTIEKYSFIDQRVKNQMKVDRIGLLKEEVTNIEYLQICEDLNILKKWFD